jgi:hypothetical protein
LYFTWGYNKEKEEGLWKKEEHSPGPALVVRLLLPLILGFGV